LNQQGCRIANRRVTLWLWLRRVLPILTVAVIVGLAYDGWIFYSRWSDAREAAKDQAAKEAEDARRTVDALGGDHLKILDFYASPVTIHRGEHASICYGVNAAQTVRIDPPVEQLHPAVSHCFQVAPARDTEYQLTIADAAGHTLTQSLSIRVGH
jgi:hypothetical protein